MRDAHLYLLIHGPGRGFVMGYGQFIRDQRERLGLTQRQLADAVGCTDGYIAHLERELKLPSLATSMALTEAFELSAEGRQQFLETVDAARLERSRERIRTRGQAVRGALRSRDAAAPPQQVPKPSAESIARDLEHDRALRDAYGDLKTALGNRAMRDTVLSALRAFAKAASAS